MLDMLLRPQINCQARVGMLNFYTTGRIQSQDGSWKPHQKGSH
uniref:Uncharacterized protein n=1 Tax=Arundo donax TaxID=35708 RepID=A0A0A9EEV6_ARUDO